MKAHYRLKTLVTLLILILVTASCATKEAFKRGTRAEVALDYDTALEQYRIALAGDPGNIEYRLKYEQTRFTAAYVHFQRGRRAGQAGDLQTARAEFRRALEIDPSHDFARQELDAMDKTIAQRATDPDKKPVNIEELQRTLQTDPNLGSQMRTTLRDKITFNMTTQSRTVYENLAALAGLSVVFHSQFRSQPVTISINNPVDIFEALDLVSLQTRNFWQPLNENTLFVMEDTPTNRRDYEDHILKTIYLTNSTSAADVNAVINVLRTSLGLRNIFPHETQNAIVIHDIPARIALAERAARALDKAKGEVIVEATIIEVDRSRLQDLGIIPPTGTSIGLNRNGAAPDTTPTVTLQDIDNLSSGGFSVAVPDAVARFLATNSNARLLQNPRIRTTDGVPAQIHVGSEIPIPTTSFTNTTLGGGANTSYQLQRVGVELNINAKVLLNREVSMVVNVTVRALAGDRQVGNLLIPSFSTRLVAHTIRVAEGETNILGGIISESELESTTGIPGLSSLPILKHIFGQQHKTREQAEVIIMLTPHIVRMPDITEDDLRGVFVGSETNLRLRPDYDNRLNAPATPAANPPAANPTPNPPAPQPRGGAALPGLPGALPGATTAPATPTSSVVSFAAPVTLAAQGATSVNLAINGSDIAGADILLTYDPAAFTIREVKDGGFLSRDGQTVAVVRNVDNQKGTARIALERSAGAAPLSGTGNIVTIELEPTSRKGSSTLRVTEFGVRDTKQVLHPGKGTEVQVTAP
jgi:general secretion pathway protein D